MASSKIGPHDVGARSERVSKVLSQRRCSGERVVVSMQSILPGQQQAVRHCVDQPWVCVLEDRVGFVQTQGKRPHLPCYFLPKHLRQHRWLRLAQALSA